jgi:peptide chain release factor subunit 1
MAANTIDRDHLRRLADVRPARGRVLSVFLNLDPAEFATPPARSTAIASILNEAARKLEACDGLDHDEQEWLRADLERVRETLNDSTLASNGARAVAVYACKPADLLEVIRLPRPVGSKAIIERAPVVEPLVSGAEGERWVVALANRRNARIFRGPGTAVEETDRITDNVHAQHDQGGWSQANYQRSVEKDMQDHLVHTAETLFEIYKRTGFEHLLIGGPDEILGDLERHLHSYLQERIAGRVHVDVENSTIEDVRRAVGDAQEALATRREREALDRLAEGIGRGARAAAGLADVLAALNEARVECLLVAERFHAPGGRDPDTGLLLTEGGEPVPDIVEAAIEKALEQSATVLRISRHDDLGPLGGIGALLRY